MMVPYSVRIVMIAVGLTTVHSVVEAKAATAPSIMMAQCRARAGQVLRMRLPDIETKYEGQRVDGTHAVNGTAYIGARTETFQCSFNRAGNRIVKFVVNQAEAAKPNTSQPTLPANVLAEIRTETVRFKPGRSSASIKGKIIGRESVSYILGAEAGQTMTITLKPSNSATYFNIYQPGKGPGDQGLANSGMTGAMVPALNRFSGKLPSSGQYTISVYMMRSAARRNERSKYTLDISISALGNAATRPPVQNDYADGLQGGPDYWDVKLVGSSRRLHIHASASSSSQVLGKASNGTVLRNRGCRMAEGRRWCNVETVNAPRVSGWIVGEYLRESSYAGTPVTSKDARVPGTNFNATGSIPCARHAGQPMGSCRFGVVRKGRGDGSVTVFWADGGNRVIFFEDGTPVSFDESRTDRNVRMTVGRNADLFTVTIGTQRFEIPEAVINGG